MHWFMQITDVTVVVLVAMDQAIRMAMADSSSNNISNSNMDMVRLLGRHSHLCIQSLFQSMPA